MGVDAGTLPGGSVRVAGNCTATARYCGIIGGDYKMMLAETDTLPEQGTCRRPAGKTCDVHVFFVGQC